MSGVHPKASLQELRERAVKTGLLDETRHAALLRDAERIVRDANIPQAALYQSMVPVCSKVEVEYIRDLHSHAANGTYGLAVCSAKPLRPIMDRFSAMAATCLRNYVSAKVMTLQDVLAALDDGAMPEPSVLLVPNFFVGAQSGGKIADWQIPPLTGLLYNRASAGLQTVLYIQYWKGLETAYGSTCAQHIAEHYDKLMSDEEGA